MRYVHTNIAARDWRKLADFYINVFQCREKPPERNLSGEWLDRATGLSQASLQGIHLWLPGYEGHGPTLEIFTYASMGGDRELRASDPGFTHIAFEVDDVEAVFQLALEHGGTRLGKVTEKEVSGVGLLTLVYFRDPEGNIVEIQSWK